MCVMFIFVFESCYLLLFSRDVKVLELGSQKRSRAWMQATEQNVHLHECDCFKYASKYEFVYYVICFLVCYPIVLVCFRPGASL